MSARPIGCALCRRFLCLFVISSLAACPAFGQLSAGPTFHIAAEPLADALVDFALQSKLSIGYSGINFDGAVSNPIDGPFTPDEALKRILAGTGYESVTIDSDTIRVRQVAATEAPTAPTPPIEEIIVTTTKRSEVAQNVPYSLVAVAGSDLDDFGIRISNDLVSHVAAFSTTDLGPGQDKLSIRGLSDSAVSGRSQSLVGLYLDESRLTDDAPVPGLRLIDINRVEIARGPQGTLYGAGTLGGIVRFITNKPRLNRQEGAVSVSTAETEKGGPSAGVDLVLNLPLVPDVLAMRAVGYFRRDGGYIDERRLRRPDANQTDTEGARVSLLWQASDDWSVTAGFTGQQIRAADSQYFQANLGYLERASTELEPHRDQLLQANVTIEGNLDWVKVTSTTTYTERRIVQQYDATPAWRILTGFPTHPATFGDLRNIQSVTQETRLTSPGNERFNWIVGTFVSHRDENYRARLAGFDAIDKPYVARAQVRDDYADEVAVFGEATYRLTDSISVTAGGREAYAALDAAAEVGRPNSSDHLFAQGTNHTAGFIPKVIVSYTPADAFILYADAAEGFRLGGVNINSPSGAININRQRSRSRPASASARTFDSDKLWTYELGAKTKFLDGRLVVNAATYLTVWDNIQSDQILRDGSLYTANAGTAHAPGFEIDLNLQATKNLRLQAISFGITPISSIVIRFLSNPPGAFRPRRIRRSAFPAAIASPWPKAGAPTRGWNMRMSATKRSVSTRIIRLVWAVIRMSMRASPSLTANGKARYMSRI